MTTTVREATHAFMRRCGMTTVFGNPGSTELKFFRDWPADFRYVLGLQESCCVAMADGYAQATRRPAFVNLHSAAGVGHALGSIFTAWRNQTPLVITAGQQTRAMFLTEPYLFASQAAEFPKPYVKSSVEPARAADVPLAIAHAWYTALQKPCGPVFVSIPEDDWDAPCEFVPERQVSAGIAPDPLALRALAEALSTARSPVLVMGAAVDHDGAWDAAIALAERLEAPVWSSPMSARASFPESHRLFAGFLPPVRAQIVKKLSDHDVIVVLGAPVFTYHIHTPGDFLPPSASLWLLTDDPDAAARAEAGVAIRCSLRLGIEQLTALLSPTARAAGHGRVRLPTPAVGEYPTGAALMAAIRRLMPENAIVVEEAPTHRNALRDFLPIDITGGFYCGASGGLGWAAAAAVGVALARPTQRIVCIVGDGSVLYAIQSIWTAVQHALPITFVIFDNGGYGALKSFGGMLGVVGAPGQDLPGLDFVSLARGFGCEAVSVTRSADVEPALRLAFEAPGPRLVAVKLADEVERLY